MNWTPLVDLYLFLVTGIGFAGALVLMRFFSLRWTSPLMKALTILMGTIAAGLAGILTSKLLSYFVKITMFEMSPYGQGVFLTLLAGGIWFVIWQVRVRRQQ